VILAGAIVSRQVGAQSSSASLTHTVTVTVPPRVKVQIEKAASATRVARMPSSNGLSLSINATQPWSLSIGAARGSRLQWSRDGKSGFTALTGGQSTVASGTLSSLTASATVFVRSAVADSSESEETGADESGPVVLTIFAQ
jgi:hypothetical protein